MSIAPSKGVSPALPQVTHTAVPSPLATDLNVKRLQRIQRLARWMDSRYRIPGLGINFGLDGLLGIIPGIGDVATGAVSLYILKEAVAAGVSRTTLARMVGNVVLDMSVGSVPVVGDLFDVFWKSNLRNVKLLELDLMKRNR